LSNLKGVNLATGVQLGSYTPNYSREISTRDSLLFAECIEDQIPDLERDISAPAVEQPSVAAAMGRAHTVHKDIVTINQTIHSTPSRTLFGIIYYRTQVTHSRIMIAGEAAEQTETKKTLVFHPASWFRRLGMRYGFNAVASYQQGCWQCNLRPVHVVPDDALIFRFCELGNIEAVREMITRGDASIYDTDSRGWSLLHVSRELSLGALGGGGSENRISR
jgi:hypothetical protein